MKKLTSLILAFMLALGCAVSLGGCGKSAQDKQAFIASRSCYSELVETLAAPVADIDADALADGAEGMTGRIRFNVEGLSSIASLLGGVEDVGDSFGFDVGIVTDGLAASGDLSLTMLGETLNALFSTDGSDVALSLPDLLPRPLLVTADMLSAGYYGDYSMLPDGAEWELLYDEDGEPYYYYSDEDTESEYFSYPDDYDEDAYSLDGYEWNEDPDDGQDIYYGGFGGMPFDFDAGYAALIFRYAESFLGSVADECYSSGKGQFRTADGAAELDCLTLKADAVQLTDALRKTFAEIADDPALDELCGGNADAMREYLREAAKEELPQEIKDQYKNYRLEWSRFSKNGATVGDRFNVKLPDGEYTLEAGVDSGADSALAFLKLTDEKQGVDLVDAESSVGAKKSKLKLSVIADGVPYSFEVSGKTTEQNGAKVTDADVKVGFGGFTVKLFSVTTTVREFDENGIDLESSLSVSLPKLLVGNDFDLALSFAIEAKPDPNAAPAMLDVSDAYTREEMESEEFAGAFENALTEKLPKLHELAESFKTALEDPAPEE